MKNKEDIVFYICVPVYKTEKYISTCILSVLNQTYENFRLILVDDGSPDQSGAICDQFAAKDHRIAVIHQENKGLIAARQAARQYIRANADVKENDYVLFMDSDDTIKQHTLEVLAKKLQEASYDMIVYGIEYIQNGKKIATRMFDGFAGVVSDKRKLYHIMLENPDYNSLCRKAIKAKMISDKSYDQYFHIKHGEDLLQSLEYYKKCKTVAFIPDALYNYMENLSSITHTVTYEKYRIDTTVRGEALRFLEQEDIWDEEDYRQYYSYCHQFMLRHVKIISRFSTSYKNKKKLYQQMCNDEYYAKLLTQFDGKLGALWALKHQYFWMISFFVIIESVIAKCKRWIKA